MQQRVRYREDFREAYSRGYLQGEGRGSSFFDPMELLFSLVSGHDWVNFPVFARECTLQGTCCLQCPGCQKEEASVEALQLFVEPQCASVQEGIVKHFAGYEVYQQCTLTEDCPGIMTRKMQEVTSPEVVIVHGLREIPVCQHTQVSAAIRISSQEYVIVAILYFINQGHYCVQYRCTDPIARGILGDECDPWWLLYDDMKFLGQCQIVGSLPDLSLLTGRAVGCVYRRRREVQTL